VLAATALIITAACSGSHHEPRSEAAREAALRAHLKPMPANALEKYMMIAGVDPDEAPRSFWDAGVPL